MIIRFFLLFSLVAVLFAPSASMAQQRQQCSLCGMDLNKYTHVRYTITTTDDQQVTTCGVQCGLLLQLNMGKSFKSAVATALLSHKTIAADKAWYLYHSKIITDMSPGFIAFASRDNAERFQKGFGGTVMTLQEALAIIKGGFK